MIQKLAAVALTAALVTGCWNNGGDTTVTMGDVSIGQQMIDLKRAYDEEAMTEAEYDKMKLALLSLGTLCRDDDSDDSDDD